MAEWSKALRLGISPTCFSARFETRSGKPRGFESHSCQILPFSFAFWLCIFVMIMGGWIVVIEIVELDAAEEPRGDWW